MLTKGKLNITIDGQFGSTGKGLLNAWLTQNTDTAPDICMTNASPNAGHTYVDDRGQKRTCFHLPVAGILLPKTHIYLCAGSIIDPVILAAEMADFNISADRVTIHPRACIVLPEHSAREQAESSGATKLASTRKGVGAALADKVARIPGPRTAAQFFEKNAAFNCRAIDLPQEMNAGKTVLMEVPQGFGLSLNHGLSYPHCTSRDITVSAALNDAGVHPHYLGKTIVSLRTFPIRVGNIVESGIEQGNSGPFYPDSREISWSDLGMMPELTTVTKRPRRIATFSALQYGDILRHLRPDTVFINFVNYFRTEAELHRFAETLRSVETKENIFPDYLFGIGPAAADVIQTQDVSAVWQTLSMQSRTG